MLQDSDIIAQTHSERIDAAGKVWMKAPSSSNFLDLGRCPPLCPLRPCCSSAKIVCGMAGGTVRVERNVGSIPALLTAGMRRDFLWPQVMRLPSFSISTLILSVQLWMAPAGKRLASF